MAWFVYRFSIFIVFLSVWLYYLAILVMFIVIPFSWDRAHLCSHWAVSFSTISWGLQLWLGQHQSSQAKASHAKIFSFERKTGSEGRWEDGGILPGLLSLGIHLPQVSQHPEFKESPGDQAPQQPLKQDIINTDIFHFHYLFYTFGNFEPSRWGNSGNNGWLYFRGLQNHCRWWLQPWN